LAVAVVLARCLDYWPQVEAESKVSQKAENYFEPNSEKEMKTTTDFDAGRRGECQASNGFMNSANQPLQHNDRSCHASCGARVAPATVVADL
jgi:hypothetical protein